MMTQGLRHRRWEHDMQVRTSKGIAAVSSGLLVATFLSGLAVGSATASAPPPAGSGKAKHPDRPTRVVQIVLDQLRPEFIDAFDMKNVKALMAGGANFTNAYLGHMASETVVSHNVMTSGMLPKHMGWADEWYRDVDGVLGTAGDMYVSGSMSPAAVRRPGRQQGLPEARGLPEGEVPGQGHRRGRPEELRGVRDERTRRRHPGHVRRPQLRLRRRQRAEDITWRGPVGVNVPTYITEPRRAGVPGDATSTSTRTQHLNYGTLDTSPAWMYPAAGQPRHQRQRPGPPGR